MDYGRTDKPETRADRVARHYRERNPDPSDAGGDTYRPMLHPGAITPVPVRIPTDAKERKGMPITTGVFDYFPLALMEIARVSKRGNDQHNPGEPLHWAKEKSTDHADCIGRHLLERGTKDVDGQLHSAKLAWRALALLEIELEGGQEAAEAAQKLP